MKSFVSFCVGVLCCLLAVPAAAQTPLTADAGVSYVMICPGANQVLGGAPTASGGTGPYTYSWTPTTGLNSSSIPNPTALPTLPTQYIVTVTDADNNVARDTITVDINPIAYADAGPDTFLCIGGQVQLGLATNFANLGYAWTPATALNATNVARPICTAAVSTLYTMTVTSGSCTPRVSTVLVNVQPLPTITVNPSVITILEGQTIQLTASGGSTYFWSPPDGLSALNGSLVNAEPIDTVTYLVAGFDEFGCVSYNNITVNVIPNKELYIYNSFSPNNDGINDLFYIGNIYKYPNCRLEVYTRTGQLVYSKGNYDNSWDGTNYGDRLPDATYYYILDLGDGSPKIYDSVTIVR